MLSGRDPPTRGLVVANLVDGAGCPDLSAPCTLNCIRHFCDIFRQRSLMGITKEFESKSSQAVM